MKVFVFDLDFTIWNAGETWCSETNPPYDWEGGKLFDQDKKWLRLYPETITVLKMLRQHQRIIAVASRTYKPEWAEQLLNLFKINSFFDLKEIYPESKIIHIEKIQAHVKQPYEQMVFFDDEQRNIEETRHLGITSVKIENGITIEDIQKYLLPKNNNKNQSYE